MEKFCGRSKEIEPGVIITYTLRPDQRPRHPEKGWRGKVLTMIEFSIEQWLSHLKKDTMAVKMRYGLSRSPRLKSRLT